MQNCAGNHAKATTGKLFAKPVGQDSSTKMKAERVIALGILLSEEVRRIDTLHLNQQEQSKVLEERNHEVLRHRRGATRQTRNVLPRHNIRVD